MKRLTDDEAADLIADVFAGALGENIPLRDEVLADFTPAMSEELDAMRARQRERVEALNTRRNQS